MKAGGIAAELEQRVAAGAIPAATLTVNRRQLDPIDRHALALLRGGDPAGSQQLRPGHGWEHEAATPGGTRAAMADAVTADIIDHGAASTVALVVSHGQAEDVADRIRRRLAAAGLLTGPIVTGPGWTTDRHYQAGDRILLHTRYGDRHSPLVNGTVGHHHRRRRPRPRRSARRWRALSDSRSGSSRASGPTGHRTCPTPGPAPSTAPKAAPGTTPTCWAPPPSTPTAATPASPAPATPPTPGTPPPSTTAITAAGSPTGAPPRTGGGRPRPHPRHHHGRRRRPLAARPAPPSGHRRPPGRARPPAARPHRASSPTPAGRSPSLARSSPSPKTLSTMRPSAWTGFGPLAAVTRAGRAAAINSKTDLDTDRAAIIEAAGSCRRRRRPVDGSPEPTRPPTTRSNGSRIGGATRSPPRSIGSTPLDRRRPRLRPRRPGPRLRHRPAPPRPPPPHRPARRPRRHPPRDLSSDHSRARADLRAATATGMPRSSDSPAPKPGSTSKLHGDGPGATRPPSPVPPTNSTPPINTSLSRPSTSPPPAGPWTASNSTNTREPRHSPPPLTIVTG